MNTKLRIDFIEVPVVANEIIIGDYLTGHIFAGIVCYTAADVKVSNNDFESDINSLVNFTLYERIFVEDNSASLLSFTSFASVPVFTSRNQKIVLNGGFGIAKVMLFRGV